MNCRGWSATSPNAVIGSRINGVGMVPSFSKAVVMELPGSSEDMTLGEDITWLNRDWWKQLRLHQFKTRSCLVSQEISLEDSRVKEFED